MLNKRTLTREERDRAKQSAAYFRTQDHVATYDSLGYIFCAECGPDLASRDRPQCKAYADKDPHGTVEHCDECGKEIRIGHIEPEPEPLDRTGQWAG